MSYMICVCLLALSLLCVARVAESPMRRHSVAFWVETVGYELLGIGAFWKSVLLFHQSADPELFSIVSDGAPMLLLSLGGALVVWTGTCDIFQHRRVSDSTQRLRSLHD